MADRKYASDYILEERLMPDGRYQTHRIYQGTCYRFAAGEQAARKLGGRLLTASGWILALLLPLLFNNSRIGRTAYVLLPMAMSLLPLYHLAAVGWRLRTWSFPLTRQQKDQTEGRLKPALAGLAAALGINTAGCGWYWLEQGLEKGEIVCVLGIGLAWGLACWLRRWRNLARMEETEKNL